MPQVLKSVTPQRLLSEPHILHVMMCFNDRTLRLTMSFTHDGIDTIYNAAMGL